jgi:pimeloyl-ACP methyl ester carboxylesterase
MEISTAHLIGYSLGANVGLYAAVYNSDRVAKLTTIGSSGFCELTGVEEFEPEWLEAHKGDWQEHMRQSARDLKVRSILCIEWQP